MLARETCPSWGCKIQEFHCKVFLEIFLQNILSLAALLYRMSCLPKNRNDAFDVVTVLYRILFVSPCGTPCSCRHTLGNFTCKYLRLVKRTESFRVKCGCLCVVQVAEIAVLLGLMCKYSCEECQLIIYGLDGMRCVELEKGTILNNMTSVLGLSSVSVWSTAISWLLTDYCVLCWRFITIQYNIPGLGLGLGPMGCIQPVYTF